MKIYHPEYHKKVWGGEYWIVNNEKYCGKILQVNEGYQCSYHFHKLKDETFYILEGMIEIVVNGENQIMREGDTLRLPPNTRHTFYAVKNSKILEVSTQHFENDSYRLIKSNEGKHEWKNSDEIKK
jgi:quercetin dioxygenase-like cupin family protein